MFVFHVFSFGYSLTLSCVCTYTQMHTHVHTWYGTHTAPQFLHRPFSVKIYLWKHDSKPIYTYFQLPSLYGFQYIAHRINLAGHLKRSSVIHSYLHIPSRGPSHNRFPIKLGNWYSEWQHWLTKKSQITYIVFYNWGKYNKLSLLPHSFTKYIQCTRYCARNKNN